MEHFISMIAIREMSEAVQSLDSRFSEMEERAARDRIAIRNMQSQLNNVSKTLQKALDMLMPKIDLLLASRGESPVSVNSTPSTTTITTPSTTPSPPAAASPAQVSPTASMTLTQAAEVGNVDVLMHLLESGVSVQERDENNDSALHLTAARGHLHALIALLGAGAAVDAAGNRLRTPLHCAAIGGHDAVVRRLLKAGAFIDAEDMSGDTPLGAAASAGKWNIVKLLLENGASSKGGKNPNRSPLERASEAGEAYIVRLLLQRGLFWKSADLWRALSFVKDTSVLWAFDDVAVGCVRGKPGENAMLLAAGQGRLESMIILLDAGVNLQAKNANGNALGYACISGRVACVKALLQRGIKTDVKDKNGFTPLHNAARRGHETCVRLLLNAGANKKAHNIVGQTPMDVASSKAVRKMFFSKIRTCD